MTESDEFLREILRRCQTIAVVGISDKPDRPSHYVSAYMQAQGYRIVPVNPRFQTVLGETCYATLEDIGFKVDLVDVFRRTEDVLPVAHSAVAVGASCLWQQMGIANQQAHQLAQAAGLQSVMNRCLKVEHARLMMSA